MTKLYPVQVTVNLLITDGELTGSVNYSMGLFKLPTEEGMPALIDKIKEQLPDNFRLMSRHEATMYVLRNDKHYRGPNLALNPLDEGEEWHDPETANTFSSLNDEPEYEED